MKLEKDCAIIETAEEAGIVGSTMYSADVNVTCDRAVTLEAITPEEGDAFFFWNPCHEKNCDCKNYTDPAYCTEYEGFDKTITTQCVKANAITTGRTVGELRELLEWAKGDL